MNHYKNVLASQQRGNLCGYGRVAHMSKVHSGVYRFSQRGGPYLKKIVEQLGERKGVRSVEGGGVSC